MNDILLKGLNGANPLGFLAALGTLRLVSLSNPSARLAWDRLENWAPVLSGVDLTPKSLPQHLLRSASAPLELFEMLGPDITATSREFEAFVRRTLDASSLSSRVAADFAASFGCETCLEEDKDRIQNTSLCFIKGSGHQHFLGTLAELRAKVQESHLAATLFEQWSYLDSGSSLRWDPADAREYALRWKEPSKDESLSQWGANWLAFEALPLFPTQPTRNWLETPGFRDAKPFEEFTWPVWETPLSCDVARSLLTLKDLYDENPLPQRLAAMGIAEAFRSQRVRIGTGKNYKVSFRPARSL